MKKEKYFVEVKCSNCDYGYPYDNGFEIPKGMREKEWSEQTECPTCGCKNTLYFYSRAVPADFGIIKNLIIEK